MEAVSKAAPSWLEAFNELRVKYGSEPVGWLNTLSEACKQHAEYLKANRRERGFGVENIQLPGSAGFTNAGRTFAQTAMVSTRGARARQVMEGWVDLPGYRNAFRNHDLRNIGLYMPVIATQPTTGGIEPAAPPITMFWVVVRFNQLV